MKVVGIGVGNDKGNNKCNTPEARWRISSIRNPKKFRVVKIHGHRTSIGVGLKVNQEYHNLLTDNSEVMAWEKGGSR